MNFFTIEKFRNVTVCFDVISRTSAFFLVNFFNIFHVINIVNTILIVVFECELFLKNRLLKRLADIYICFLFTFVNFFNIHFHTPSQ